MNPLAKVKFLDWDCDVLLQKYANGRKALELADTYDGSRVAIATVNLPDVNLAHDEVIIRNYSETEGMLETLITAGIIEQTGRTVASGFVDLEICKLIL